MKTIKQLKKQLGLTNKDLAQFFDMSLDSFQNTTAKKRYENALCRFYNHIKKTNRIISIGKLKTEAIQYNSLFTEQEQFLLENIIIEKQLEKNENNQYVNADNGINEILESIKRKLFPY